MYTQGVIGLHETVLPLVPGLEKVQNGEPTNAHDTPLVYTLFEGFTRNDVAAHYVVMLRLAIPVPVPDEDDDSDAPGPFEVVEEMIAPFVNSIPAAIYANSYLGYVDNNPANGGRCDSARVTEARSGEDEGFIAIGGVLCRCITFRVEIVEKIRNRAGV